MLPSIWTLLGASALVAGYCWAFRWYLSYVEAKACRAGPQWLGLLAWRILNIYSGLVGVNLASEGGEGLKLVDPTRRYLIAWHPHGFLAWSAMFILCRQAVAGEPCGREWFAMVAPALFRLPIVGEMLLLVNGRRVDRKVFEHLLSSGASVAVQPGGVTEQLMTRHDQEQVVFPKRLGFIRQAIKHGVDYLMPCYIFQETQMYRRVEGLDWLSSLIRRTTGLGLPFVTARFGLPMAGLLPMPTDIHVRWGKPVEVGEKELEPSEERVEELYNRYVAALHEVFDQHAHDCLPPELAKRGLKVIRLRENGDAQ